MFIRHGRRQLPAGEAFRRRGLIRKGQLIVKIGARRQISRHRVTELAERQDRGDSPQHPNKVPSGPTPRAHSRRSALKIASDA
jgi:hypothetical protein